MTINDMCDWLAGWISSPEEDTDRAPCFRKAFSLSGKLKQGVLYICGLGYHELYLNGEKIGDGVLEPGQTDYNRRAFYLTHRVESFMRQGENVIGVILGNGFFCQDKVWCRKDTFNPSYGKPRLQLQLELTYEDGRIEYILSDESWLTRPSPIIANNVYAGESYDARQETERWNLPGNVDTGWQAARFAEGPGGELLPQKIPPIKIIEELPVKQHWCFAANEMVLDFGQNMSGWVAFSQITGKAGETIRFTYAENISGDRRVDTASTGVFATKVEQVDTYTFSGKSSESWEPRFTYHGFRYARVKVSSTTLFGSLNPGMFTAKVVHTQLDKTGHFECSNAMLNRLHEMSLWTYRGNVHSIPEDCPARERCGWLADAFIAMETGIYNFDTQALYKKYLEDIDTTREDGIPWDIAPGKRRCGRGVSDWVAARVIIPWYLYIYFGDKATLRGAYRGMHLVHDYFNSIAEDYILSNGRGDWCDPKKSAEPYHTDERLTTTIWYYVCTNIMADTAKVIPLPQHERAYRETAEKIKKAFQLTFYDEKHDTYGSQTADALAITFGLVPDNRQDEAAQSLADTIIHDHSGHMSCGIYGIRYLFHVLSKTGHEDVIAEILSKDTEPSYGNMINRGATTLWEYWGEQEVDEAHGPRSLNHPMMTGFDVWFYQGLLGIQPDPEKPGFREIRLQPVFPAWLESAKGYFDSANGRIESDWHRDGDQVVWTITVPEACTAVIDLGCAGDLTYTVNGKPSSQPERIQAGRYELKIMM